LGECSHGFQPETEPHAWKNLASTSSTTSPTPEDVHPLAISRSRRTKTHIVFINPQSTTVNVKTEMKIKCRLKKYHRWNGGFSVGVFCFLPGRGLCEGLITLPKESYRLWCVVVCLIKKLRERGGLTPLELLRHGKGKESRVLKWLASRYSIL